MLRFLYATDLHGDTLKYRVLQHYALKLDVNLIHLGADILPKGNGMLKRQKQFVNGFLKMFYEECHEHGIKLLAFFGNDDVYTRKDRFRAYGQLLDEQPYEQDGYKFTAYGYVPDYRFLLKTACKWDSKGWRCPEPYNPGLPVDVDEKGFVDIPEDMIEAYFAAKGTIEDDLKKMEGGARSIVAIHTPPSKIGLDVVAAISEKTNGVVTLVKERKVGSDAVHQWIKRTRPKLVLSGHVHESPQASGIWKAKIGNTLVIQPGQEERKAVFVAVEITPSRVHVERFTPDL